MPGYKGVSEATGLEVIKESGSYRAVLDAARSLAHREVSNVIIVDVDQNAPVMIVQPDGRTRIP